MAIQDEFIQAVDYMIQSPFVRKIKGLAIPDEWGPSRTQRETAKFDNLIAKEICKSTYMLADVRKKLEEAKEVIARAGQDEPELCAQALTEFLNNRITSMQAKVDAAQGEFDALPKVDENFMRACREEKNAILAERDVKKEAIQEQCLKNLKKYTWTALVFVILFACLAFVAIVGYKQEINYPSQFYESNLKTMAVCLVVGVLGGISSIAVGVKQLAKRRRIQNTGIYPQSIENTLKNIDKEYDPRLADLQKQMERGYSDRSDFSLKLHLAEGNVMQVKLIYADEVQKLEIFKDIFRSFFEEAPLLLQKTMDNMDSLVLWAKDYIHDKEVWQHNERMQSIEQEKLRVQEATNRKQNELLKRQADAAQAAERYAKEQAAAAARQAEDTAEIKERMRRERYGDYWKTP